MSVRRRWDEFLNPKPSKRPGPFYWGLAVVILVLVWASFGFYRVDAAERGLEFRFGAFQTLTQPGWQWHWPWPIEHVEIPPSDLKAGLLAEGTPERIADWLLDLERYYRENRASIITNDIERVTGHAPRRFADSARDFAPHLRAE